VQHAWDVASGEALFALANESEIAQHVTFSPDGTRLAAVIAPAPTGDEVITMRGLYTLDGTINLLLDTDHVIRLWDVSAEADPGTVIADYAPPEDRLLALDFAPDGTLLLAGSTDNQPIFKEGPSFQHMNEPTYNSRDFDTRLWDVVAGELVATVPGSDDPLATGWIAPDAAHLVGLRTGDSSYFRVMNILLVWDLAAPGEDPLRLNPEWPDGAVAALSFSPDGTTLATVHTDSGGPTGNGSVMLWDVASGELLADLTGEDPLPSLSFTLAFSPDGGTLAVQLEGCFRLWDVATGTSLPVPDFFMGAISQVTFGPEGRWLATAGRDGAIRVWDPASDALLTTIRDTEGGIIAGTLHAAPDGTLLAKTWAGNDLQHWDPLTGTALDPVATGYRTPLVYAFHPGGNLLVTGRLGGSITFYDLSTGAVDGALLTGHQVSALAFSPDGTQLVTGGMGGMIKLWELAQDDEPVLSWPAHSGAITDLVFQDDGATLLSASRYTVRDEGVLDNGPFEHLPDRTVRRWDAASGAALHTWEPEADVALEGAISPDGRWLAVPGAGADQTIRILDTESGAPVAALADHVTDSAATGLYTAVSGPASYLAWSPDGTYLAAASHGGVVHLWRLAAE